MTYKRFLTACIIFTGLAGILSFTFFDEDTLTKIKQQLDKWAYEQPVEKVYLQLDKPYYAAGDDIWFKAYVVSGSEHQLSNVSGIVNVELIDWRDSVKQSVKLPLQHGAAWGDFALPDTLQQGNYRIRAYTSYMRNAGSGYFFNQSVSIINTIRAAKKETVKNSRRDTLPKLAGVKANVQFFPEGGALIGGITTKVAFKAIAPNGLGIAISGNITGSKGNEAAVLNTAHLGMGVFELTPLPGEKYTANIVYADGTRGTVPLPPVMDKGYILNITEAGENLKVKIATSRALFLENPNRQLVLVGQSGGKMYYAGKSKPGVGEFISLVSKSKFPTGIVQFTLFSSAGEPLNERLVFVQNPNRLNLNITSAQQRFSPQQKVKLNINALHSDGKPAAGNFSVSVIDETKVPVNEDTENNIMASLLLTADLRGYVEQPAYYFNKVNDKTRADLDILMLTQGYHRFEWKQLLKDALPAKTYRPENSLQVSGTILTPGGKPVVNGKVKLIDLDSIKYERDTVTDERGRFVFKDLTFYDSVRFIIQARTPKNKKDVVIHMDQVLPAGTGTNKNRADYEVNMSSTLSAYAQSSKQLYAEQLKYGLGNHVISLQEVIIREKKQALRASSNLNGAGNADQIIQGRDLRKLNCIYLTDCLQGRLIGVIFRNGIPYSTRGYGAMQVIIDGVYVDPSYLNSINYNDIQAIEVLRSIGLSAIYGGRGGNGVLLVTTRRGGETDYTEPIFGRGITTYYPKGFYKAREFYSPQYDRPKTNKQVANLRTTIYWKPDLLTGNDGQAYFEYFNAGSSGTYRVVIEGVDSDGNLGRQVYRYKVE